MEYCNETLKVSDLKLQPFLQYLLGAVMALLVIVTVVGNAMTIAAYIIDKRLRSVYNTYIFNLAITDLFIGLISMPFWAYYTLSHFHWYLGRIFCKAWLAADFTLCLESVLMILTLSYDRLLLIRYGHRYEIKVTMRRAIVKIVITWTVAFLLYGPAIIGWDIWSGCSILDKYVCDVEFAHNRGFTIATAIIEFFLPIKGLLIINGLLYCKIRRLMFKTVKDENETEGLTGDDTLDTLTDQNDVTLSTSLKESTNAPSNETQDVSRTNGKENKIVDIEQKVSIETNNKAIKDENKSAPTATLKEDKNKEVVRADKEAKQHDISKLVDTVKEETKRNNEEGIEKDDANIAVIGVDGDEKHYVDGGTPLNEEEERKDRVPKTHVRSKSDITETEPSDILISVLGVMEKHGSGILTTTDLGSDEESPSRKGTSEVDEDAKTEASSANNHEEGLDTTKPRNEITNTLKRKISSYANRVLHARQSVESVGLEKLKDENLSVQRENNTEKDTYEERDIDLAIREHQASHSVLTKRKESTQSNVSSRIRRNTKAARFLATLVFVFFVCWAPYTIATIVSAFCTEDNDDACVRKIVYEVLTWLLWVKSAINPFLYAYNSSRYRENFARFLSCCCRKRK